ncbi:PREDICTED: uncharacterized protein LOC106744536 [Dinoponera quadriceps]|uniref:Uncharacterized protein LOC106744536 n=1 Tax=Dinoponera quadriceps TaxID=609295 RepID=A0A6P3X999_DINQU|nr:PREDICTED: uncharacterized protein LOC106744536 [Dinoponera quadriceps]
MASPGTVATVMLVFETIKSEPSASETANSETIDPKWHVYDSPASETLVFETVKSEPYVLETIDSRISALGTSASQTSACETRGKYLTFLKKNLMEALDAITHGMTLREASKTYRIPKTSLLRYCKKLIPDSMRRTSRTQCATNSTAIEKATSIEKQT